MRYPEFIIKVVAGGLSAYFFIVEVKQLSMVGPEQLNLSYQLDFFIINMRQTLAFLALPALYLAKAAHALGAIADSEFWQTRLFYGFVYTVLVVLVMLQLVETFLR